MEPDWQDAWEGWIRPLLLLLVAAGLVALWYFEVVSDGTTAVVMLSAAAIAASVATLVGLFSVTVSPVRRGLGVLVVLASVGLAGATPYGLLAGDQVTHRGVVEADGVPHEVPPAEPGRRKWVLHLHGEPRPDDRSVSLDLRLEPKVGGELADHKVDELSSKRRQGMQQQATGRDKHEIVWSLTTNLAEGARLIVKQAGKTLPAAPLDVVIRPAVRTPPWVLVVGALLALLGMAVDVSVRSVRVTRVGVLAAAALGVSVLFPQLFAPTAATKATAGALFLGSMVGTLAALAITALLRARFGHRPRPPSPPDDVL